MLMSMNAFHQTRPKLLLCFPSSNCHGRRIPYKHVLVSPATMKLFSQVLFAMPRNNEEFSSDNEEEPIVQEHEEHCTSISSDNVHEERYVVRKATLDAEFWASACLKAQGFYEDRSHQRYVSSFKKKHAEEEFTVIMRRCRERAIQPFMCIIAVRKGGGNVLDDMLNNVIGTLDFRVECLLQGETYPEEVFKANMFKTFKKRESQKYGIISNVIVAKSARRQGVGSSMLKFAIESAKENGIKQVILYVCRDNKPALSLYRKMGFTILEEHNQCACCINL